MGIIPVIHRRRYERVISDRLLPLLVGCVCAQPRHEARRQSDVFFFVYQTVRQSSNLTPALKNRIYFEPRPAHTNTTLGALK